MQIVGPSQNERKREVEQAAQVAAVMARASAAGRGPRSGRDRGGRKLDHVQDIVPAAGESGHGRRYRVSQCGCQSVWCEHCRERMASQRRAYLREVTSRFVNPHLLTLTVDPQRFPGGPGQAYDWQGSRRLIATLMARFRRSFVCVLEVHKNGFPHWHILIDGRIDIVKVRSWWNAHAGILPAPLKPDGKPRSAQIDVERVEPGRVAGYLCGYLLKGGKAPEWIRQRRNVRGISVSRGLLAWSRFLKRGKVKGPERVGAHAGGPWSKIGQRLDRCGSRCVVLVEDDQGGEDPDGGGGGGGGQRKRWRYVGRLNTSLRGVQRAAERLGISGHWEIGKKVLAWMRYQDGAELVCYPLVTRPHRLRSFTTDRLGLERLVRAARPRAAA